MNKVLKLSYCLFFNGERGVEILKLFKTKKFRILNVFIAKKFLRPKILKKNPKEYQFYIN